MPKKKWLNKKEAVKALKKWIKEHKEDSSYNLTISRNFTLAQKGLGMDDSQFAIMLGEVKDLGKRLDKIEDKLADLTVIVKKNHPDDFKK